MTPMHYIIQTTLPTFCAFTSWMTHMFRSQLPEVRPKAPNKRKPALQTGSCHIFSASSTNRQKNKMSAVQLAVLPGRGSCAISTLHALQQQQGVKKVRVVVRDSAKKHEAERIFPAFEAVVGDLDFSSSEEPEPAESNGSSAGAKGSKGMDALTNALVGVERVLLVPPTVPNREQVSGKVLNCCCWVHPRLCALGAERRRRDWVDGAGAALKLDGLASHDACLFACQPRCLFSSCFACMQICCLFSRWLACMFAS